MSEQAAYWLLTAGIVFGAMAIGFYIAETNHTGDTDA